MLFCIFMWPFVCRERFWYYIVSVQLASFAKINLKMLESEPRPTWAWGSDIASYGCASSFGSPSGHSTRSSNLAFLIILDMFFASDWSRKTYAELKQKSPKSHIFTFLTVLLVTITFWLAQLYDRVFLGKHGINQVILGSQLGIWCACFSHYVLRDCVFAHITRLTQKTNAQLSSYREPLSYIGFGSAVILTSVAITCIVGLVMNASGKLQQEWLINIRDACGEKFDVDETTGLLVANTNGMYLGTITDYVSACGILGLYIGEVLFRFSGNRTGLESYSTKGFCFQLITAVTFCGLYQIPIWVQHEFEVGSLWAQAIFVIALPHLLIGLTLTYLLPTLM